MLPLAVDPGELDAIAAAEPVGARRAQLERERLGVDHAHAGALLAERSGASAEVVDAIAYHHGGRSGQDAGSPEGACVQLANALAAVLAGATPDAEVIHAALGRLALPHAAIDELAEHGLPAAADRPRDSLAARVQELERLASIDDLTGLSNRRHWLSQIRARLAQEPGGGLLLCDIDHFKQINDRHGHRTGDLVLSEIARLLTRHGLAGRLGGDEFALWVPDDRHQASAAANAILYNIDHELAAPGTTASVGISIGSRSPPTTGTPSLLYSPPPTPRSTAPRTAAAAKPRSPASTPDARCVRSPLVARHGKGGPSCDSAPDRLGVRRPAVRQGS